MSMSNNDNDYECDDVSTVLMANPRRFTLSPTKMNAQPFDAQTLSNDLIGAAHRNDLGALVDYVPQYFNADDRDRATDRLRMILGGNANALISRLGAVPADYRGGFINIFQCICELAIANARANHSVPNAPASDSSLSATAPGDIVPFAGQDDPSRGSDEVALRPGHANEPGRQQRLPEALLGAGLHGNPQQEEVAALRRTVRALQLQILQLQLGAPANANANVAGGPAQINNLNQVGQVPNVAAMPMPAQMANQPGQNQNNDNNNNNNDGNPQFF